MMTMDISITQLEQAINYWRNRCPATGEEGTLSAEVNALAEVYALSIVEGRRQCGREDLSAMALRAFEEWTNNGLSQRP